MKNLIFLGCTFVFMLLLVSCKNENADSKDTHTNSYEQISQNDAKTIMETEVGYTILDVRTKEEYEDGHIKNAICIPVETISESISETLPDKNQLILVYCRSGNRSKKASQKLADLGYTNVKEFGGINTWEDPLEK